jgi:hypothetical protein
MRLQRYRYEPPVFAAHPVAAAVREACLQIQRRRPAFVKPCYRHPERPLQGCCYVGTEAFYHLIGGDYLSAAFLERWTATGLVVMYGSGGPHWSVRTDANEVIEFTDIDEDDEYPYEQDVAKSLRKDGTAHRKPFMTVHPSRRARRVIGLVDPSHPHALLPW